MSTANDTPVKPHCMFCKRPKNEVKRLVSGGNQGPWICNRCVEAAYKSSAEDAVKAAATKEEPLRKPLEIIDFLNQFVIGQDKAKRTIAVAVYNHYKRRIALQKGLPMSKEGVEIQKSNILLLGPSGTGKTEIARAIARMLSVPFYIADATRLTQSGYVGDDVETLLQGLMQDADGDVDRAQWGLVYIDEFDKLGRKSGRNASGYRDVSGEGVQQALLKLIEGGQVAVPRGMGVKMISSDAQRVDMIDTSNILFICAGSFAGIEEVVTQRKNKSSRMGFGAKSTARLEGADAYLEVTDDDVLDFGIIPELAGRLPVMTTTLPLTEDQMVQILTEPKNAIVKQYKALFAMDNVELEFDEGALRRIAQKAMKSPKGARALRSVMEAVLEPYCVDCPSDPGIRTVRITELAIDGADAVITRKTEAEVAAGGVPPEPQVAQA